MLNNNIWLCQNQTNCITESTSLERIALSEAYYTLQKYIFETTNDMVFIWQSYKYANRGQETHGLG